MTSTETALTDLTAGGSGTVYFLRQGVSSVTVSGSTSGTTVQGQTSGTVAGTAITDGGVTSYYIVVKGTGHVSITYTTIGGVQTWFLLLVATVNGGNGNWIGPSDVTGSTAGSMHGWSGGGRSAASITANGRTGGGGSGYDVMTFAQFATLFGKAITAGAIFPFGVGAGATTGSGLQSYFGDPDFTTGLAPNQNTTSTGGSATTPSGNGIAGQNGAAFNLLAGGNGGTAGGTGGGVGGTGGATLTAGMPGGFPGGGSGGNGNSAVAGTLPVVPGADGMVVITYTTPVNYTMSPSSASGTVGQTGPTFTDTADAAWNPVGPALNEITKTSTNSADQIVLVGGNASVVASGGGVTIFKPLVPNTTFQWAVIAAGTTPSTITSTNNYGGPDPSPVTYTGIAASGGGSLPIGGVGISGRGTIGQLGLT